MLVENFKGKWKIHTRVDLMVDTQREPSKYIRIYATADGTFSGVKIELPYQPYKLSELRKYINTARLMVGY